MKLSWLVFGLLLAMCAILAALFIIGEPSQGLNFQHPEHASLQQGRPGTETQANIKWPALLFGILQFCLAAALMALSINKKSGLKILIKPLAICMILCITVFSLMVAAYWVYIQKGSGPLFGSFPLPTALMLYGIWPLSFLFAVVYVKYYDKAIFTEEDNEKFQALVKSNRQDNQEETDGS